MSESEPSADQVNLDNILLLEEVLAYLKRLPNVPVTVELARKVMAHLENPVTATAHRRAAEDERMRSARRGGVYGVVTGLPLVEVVVYPDAVQLRLTHRIADHARLQAKLADGIEVPLGVGPVEEPLFPRGGS